MSLLAAGASYAACLQNQLKAWADLQELDQQIYLECMVMHRIKYAVETLDYDESPLMWEGAVVDLQYDFEDVTAVYHFDDRDVTRYYHYDLSSRTLRMVDEFA